MPGLLLSFIIQEIMYRECRGFPVEIYYVQATMCQGCQQFFKFIIQAATDRELTGFL